MVKVEDAYNSFKRELEVHVLNGMWGEILATYSEYVSPIHYKSDKIKKIQVSQEINDIEDFYLQKMEIIDVKVLAKKHDEELKHALEFIYEVNVNKQLHEDTILILTQPLGNYYCDRKTQIKMYEVITNRYKKADILIKPHPADFVDYKKFGYKVLPRDVPIEVYNLTDKQIAKVITFGSSGIYTVEFAKEKELLFRMDDFTSEEVSEAINEIAKTNFLSYNMTVEAYQKSYSKLKAKAKKNRLIRKIFRK